MTNVQ
jgi:hypothetical protein